MAREVSEYHHGEMDIHEQATTYHRVMAMSKWGALHLAALVLFLTMWFCTAAGFLAAAITAIVVVVLGVLLLRDRGDSH